MANQKELDGTYMQVALQMANLSKAKRAKVGACLVTKHGVMLSGYNGTPKGLSNVCEQVVHENWNSLTHQTDVLTKTLPEVIHAETNAVLKAAREGVSTDGATMYVTLSPCVPCAALLINAGISRLIYKEIYRSKEGVELLQKAGILTEQIN